MRHLILRSAALIAAAYLLSGCREYGPETGLATPPDYSPRYTHVTAVNEQGRTKRVLAPEACLTPDEQSPADTGEPRVPPGCANNYNLQRMAERKRDLTQGRPLGRAPAAPASRAAQRYIDGRDAPVLGGAFRDDDEPSTPSATTAVPQR